MSRIGVGGAILLAWFVFPAWARQDPQPVPHFRSGTDLVVLDVSVLDPQRMPVRGLTAGDFTVYEDGRPQMVATFNAVDLPETVADAEPPAPWVREVAPDVVTNADFQDRRVMVIVMDDATPMPAVDVLRARTCARRVIEALGPRDFAAVVFALNKRDGEEFTQDRGRLFAAVARFNGALDQRLGLDGNGNPKKMLFDEFDASAATLYHSLLGTVRGVANDLAKLPERRKALVFVSVGIPLEFSAAGPSMIDGSSIDKTGVTRQVLTDLLDSLRAAQQANVNIYPIDPGGLRAPYDNTVGSADPANPGRINREFLQTVSDHTGGFSVLNTNDPVPGIRQVLRENSSYYLLGYVPINRRQDGRFRKIEVQVKRPGVIVRTRAGYYAPQVGKPGKPVSPAPVVEHALAGLLPNPDLTMQVSALPFATPGGRDGRVAVVVGVRQRAPASRVAQTIDLRLAAFGRDGEWRAGQRLTVPVTLPTSGGTVRYELLAHIELAPGRYYLRISADSAPTATQTSAAAPSVAAIGGAETKGRSGSVFCDLDVPDFLNDALSLSGVVLSVTPGIVSGPKDALASIVPVVPTTLREFTVGDTVTAFVRAYQGGRNPLLPVALDVRVLDANDVRVFEAKETLAGERFATGRSADYSVPLPISRLSPGRYLFSIEAASRGRTVRRDVRFQVR